MGIKKKKQAQVSGARLKDFGSILRPLITEKSALIGGHGNGVVFIVPPQVSKTQIKEAVENVFKVQVEKVRTVNYLGKPKRTTGHIGNRVRFKKAYIQLKAGSRIDIVEGV